MSRISAHRIKIHRSYTIEEVARCLSVHKNTVRRWLKSGLSAIDARRPTLIHGATLRSYLEDRRRTCRQPCGQGELFCFRCHQPRAPAGGMLDYLPFNSIFGNLRGICGTCNSLIRRRVALSRIGEAAGNCDVAFPQGLKRLGDSNDTSLNVDFAAIGQARDDEQC